jgi:hypothetical protein
MLAGGGTKFFRDLSVLVGGQIAVKLLGLVAFAYLARRLDLEAYGSVEFIVGSARQRRPAKGRFLPHRSPLYAPASRSSAHSP